MAIIQSKAEISEIFNLMAIMSIALIFINEKLKLKNGNNYNRGSK